VARRIVDREMANVALINIVEGIPQGKVLELLKSGPVEGNDCQVVGTNDYRDTAKSDIVV
jgi:malate dehydrogenase